MPLQPLRIKFLVFITVCVYTVIVKSETPPVEPKAINGIQQGSNWYHQYGANPYTVLNQPQAVPVARDSYSDAATDLGYGGGGGGGGGGVGGGGGGGYGGGGGGHDHGHGQPSTYHYQVYPGGGHSSGGGGYGASGDDDGGDYGGGGIGLLGLLGLKGLKGLGVFKIAKAAAVLAPLLGPLLLPILLPLLLLLLAPLLLLPLLLLFIPIPVVTVPGRSFSWLQTARMTQDALTNEECFERITCEAVRVARGYGFDAPWMKNYLEKSASKNKWMERISRAVHTTECKKYICGLVNPMKKVLRIN